MRRVVLAFDKFRGTATNRALNEAGQRAATAAKTLRAAWALPRTGETG